MYFRYKKELNYKIILSVEHHQDKNNQIILLIFKINSKLKISLPAIFPKLKILLLLIIIIINLKLYKQIYLYLNTVFHNNLTKIHFTIFIQINRKFIFMKIIVL